MRIVNTTGLANDTKVFNDKGEDITADLNLVEIRIAVGEPNVAILRCEFVKCDVVAEPENAQ